MKAQNRVIEKIQTGKISKIELSLQLGISRPTLNTRLSIGNWKKGELKILESM